MFFSIYSNVSYFHFVLIFFISFHRHSFIWLFFIDFFFSLPWQNADVEILIEMYNL